MIQLYERLLALAHADTRPARVRLDEAVRCIHETFGRHQWTGVYVVRGDVLELESFVGPPSEHTRIPVGVGMCGKAVADKHDLDIGDVTEAEGYLACSLSTKAEAIALIWSEGRPNSGKIVGQIDVDSDQGGAFGEEHMRKLRAAADLLAPIVLSLSHTA